MIAPDNRQYDFELRWGVVEMLVVVLHTGYPFNVLVEDILRVGWWLTQQKPKKVRAAWGDGDGSCLRWRCTWKWHLADAQTQHTKQGENDSRRFHPPPFFFSLIFHDSLKTVSNLPRKLREYVDERDTSGTCASTWGECESGKIFWRRPRKKILRRGHTYGSKTFRYNYAIYVDLGTSCLFFPS